MKAETDLYCPKCGDKIYDKGDTVMSLFFTRSEERCSNCDTMLKRRSPGGQSDTWNFIAHPLGEQRTNVKEIRIKYLRKDRSGKETEFWSGREVGQVIEEDAFHGLIDEVLEIVVVLNHEVMKMKCPDCETELIDAKLVGPYGMVFTCEKCEKYWTKSELLVLSER